MDNLGKAIYFASFALIFVFAASISIFLYSTVNVYVQKSNESTNLSYRAEDTSNEDLRNFKREITVGEILITLYNMEQMHVSELKVNGYAVTPSDIEENNSNFRIFKSQLNSLTNAKFTYSSSGETVIYKSK